MKKEKGTAKDTGLRRRAEERLKGGKKKAAPPPAEPDALRMVHELEVHQIELEMQNEELGRAREELERQVAKYSDLYNFAPIGYFALDRAGIIREANLTGAKLLGIDRSGLVGRRLDSFLGAESQEPFAGCLREIYEKSVGSSCELALLAPAGYVHIEATPVAFDGGPVERCGVVMIDITERKKAEGALDEASRKLIEAKAAVDRLVEERTSELTKAYERLRIETEERQRAETELRQAHKMEAVGTLAGGIAHDFNNILAAIIGFSEIALGHTPEGSPVRRHMERVFAAGIRGRELIKQILAFSRQAEPKKQPLSIATVVDETLKLLRASLPTTIGIRTSFRRESPYVFADPTQMQQVLLNLCTNAAHAMRLSGGSISIDLADFSFSSAGVAPDPTMSPGLYAKLAVRDVGIGMSPEMIEHIFDPFFTTKATGEGTGLGLSVVHGIVKQHDGFITVESEPDKGSTFTIYLPAFMEEQSRVSGDGGASIQGGHESILFIDDEKDLATVGDEMLTGLGYRVTARTGARAALAVFRLDPSRFDLIITDQTMPELTGVELAREVLSIRPDVPIIMCTGFSHLVNAEAARAAGIKAFVMKPLTKREIAKAIRRVLDE